MNKLGQILANEPLRLRVYTCLAVLLPLLKAFGVDLADGQTVAILAFAYAVLIGGTEAARSKVTPA